VSDPADPPRRPITRERWQRLAPLVDAVLDQPPERRLAYIAEISDGDDALADELARFVRTYGDQLGGTADPSILGAAEDARSALMTNRSLDGANDLRAQLQQSLGASYVVEREIGGGGMSRVFVAEEPGLGRKVVIKVLPPEMCEGISGERFAREIKLAASLQQANIVPLLATGTAAGFPYYTMPFVEGRSLRERLARGEPLPLSEAISILRDVARALAFAHGRGVIHRDIKPGNILLSDRTAVVTDFGIAKALGAARGAAGATQEKLSFTGASVGTPAYMPPEQASGDPNLDHRADIYSFGCVAYELLTGQPPFTAASPHQVIAAHFQETPRPVTELRPEVPAAVARLVASCLEKEPSRRPQSAEDLLLALDNASSQPVALPPPRPRRMTLGVSIGVLVAALGLGVYALRSSEKGPLTFAVVPFRNLARDTALDYRSDGIGDEILNGVAKVRGIQIVGRTAAFRYKDRPGAEPADARTVERALGARLLLTGTLRENEGRIVISAQLDDSTSHGEIWSESFTRSSSDLGSITDEIVRRITDTLRARFGKRVERPRRAASAVGTTNPAALDLYLVGQEQLRRRGSGVAQAVESFQRAIDLDPTFARAHAALAGALGLIPYFTGTAPAADFERVVAEARRALALDSTLADAYTALGIAHGNAGQWKTSDAELRRAIELEPDNAMARQTFARHLILRDEAAEALDQLERARKLEPLSPLISAWLAYGLFLDGRPDSAVAETERTIQLDSTLLASHNLGALVYLALGKKDAALRLSGVSSAGMTSAPYVYAKVGDTAAANRLVREIESRSPRPWFVDVAKASVLLGIGDSTGALNALERSAHDTGPLWALYIPLGDPAFDPVRKSARFAALLRQADVDLSTVVMNPRRTR
jgi:serine/threonine-protein kinase